MRTARFEDSGPDRKRHRYIGSCFSLIDVSIGKSKRRVFFRMREAGFQGRFIGNTERIRGVGGPTVLLLVESEPPGRGNHRVAGRQRSHTI